MILTDTHTHLYSIKFAEDRETIIQEAFNSKVERMFLPNIDRASVDGMLQLAKKYPSNCFPMIGLHPCEVKENWKEELSFFEELAKHHTFYAIGEIGVDLYWDKTTLEIQKEAFIYQIEWAKKLQLPIVIHARESFEEIFEVLDTLNDESLTGIFHCFTGTLEQANKVIAYGGFKIGIGGVLTFKNSGLDKVVRAIDMKHIVLETDAPYLAPNPYRGKRNESSYIPIIAHKLAEIKEINLEEVASITTNNSIQLFGV